MGRGRQAPTGADLIYRGFGRPASAARNATNNRKIVIERMYQRILGELAMNRFEWKGFEDTGVSTRFLEMQLYMSALCVVFKDTNIYGADGNLTRAGTDKIFAVRGAPSGTKNLVDDPTSYTLTGTNFQGRRVGINECVPVWANYFRQPDLDIVYIYSERLAEIDLTIEINSKNARRNKVLAYSENQSLTAKNINDMLDRGEASIPVNLDLGQMVTALDLGVDPRSLDSLSVLRSKLWGEAMGLLGINNSNQDKKERLVEAEVGANDDQVSNVRRVNLNARQNAAAMINDMFGLGVSVDYYTEINNDISASEIEVE